MCTVLFKRQQLHQLLIKIWGFYTLIKFNELFHILGLLRGQQYKQNCP